MLPRTFYSSQISKAVTRPSAMACICIAAVALAAISMLCHGCGGSSPERTVGELLKAARDGNVSAIAGLVHSQVLEAARMHAAMRGIGVNTYILESFTGGAPSLPGLSWKIESTTKRPNGSVVVRYTINYKGLQETGLHMVLLQEDRVWKFAGFLQ